jgi:hypothetical protein
MNDHFEGTLTAADAKRHILHSFEVGPNTSRLRIRLWHSEGFADGLNNMLTLSLFDPQGCRGAGHREGESHEGGRLHVVMIDAARATSGYHPGALPAGTWIVEIDTHRITPAEPCIYRVDIDVDASVDMSEPLPSAPSRTRAATVQARRGWYRGDLHGHTVHSDGSWDVPDLIASARRFKLDFVSLTDHNTVSALPQMDAARAEDLLTIGGMELTTFYGHALALGTREWVDWRVRDGAFGSRRTMPVIAEEVTADGHLFIIAHPASIGDPFCTGCDWTYDDMMPGPAKIVEVWNGGDWDSDSNNERALALYYAWLDQRYRLVATAGTDVHGPFPEDACPGFDVVYAEALDERAILGAIAQGHLYLSSGPQLEFTARASTGAKAMMGDVLTLAGSGAIVEASWSDCSARDRVRLIVDGDTLEERSAGAQGQHTWQLDADQAHWCLIEVRDENDRIAALTNPIFLNGESKAQVTPITSGL